MIKVLESGVWSGKLGNNVKCPYPECNHTGAIITKAHCRLVHDMEREYIGLKYGAPKQVRIAGVNKDG